MTTLILLSACTPARRGGSVEAPPEACSDTASTLHLFVGVAGPDMPATARQRALSVLGSQVQKVVSSAGGSPNVLVSVYPLTGSSFEHQALRAAIPCVPVHPIKPDTLRAGLFGSEKANADYQEQVRKFNKQLAAARSAADSVNKQLREFQSPAGPVDIWGAIGMATREFAEVLSDDRYVVFVARDETIENDFCTDAISDCYALRNARVVFLGFDMASNGRQYTRASEWASWLKVVGAGDVQFVRTNDPPPPIFQHLRS